MKLRLMSMIVLSTVLMTMFAVITEGLLPDTQTVKGSFLEPGVHEGKVIATMNSGGYTYVQFEENGKKPWAACPQTDISVGDTIIFSHAAPMKNFYSKTLDRTFASIFFVGRIKVKGRTTGGLPEGHAPVNPVARGKITVEPGSVKKAADGYTVAECYAKKSALKGNVVKVRGRVVKFIPKIMGKNWVHIRDGTGQKGSNDLTITTKETVQVGDLILVTGTIVYDKDFGAGYLYPVIIEDASIVVE